MNAQTVHPADQLKRDRFNWHPHDPTLESRTLSSGIHALDDVLPDGGWRRGALTEILSATDNDTALNLVLPALATLSQEHKWLAWVGPPRFLDKLKLAHAGIETSRVLLVHPRTSANGLWLIEQVLRAGTCGAVLTWMTGGDAGDGEALRRMQVAAELGGTLGFVFRSESCASQASPVATRLLLKKQQQKLQLQVLTNSWQKHAVPRVLKFSANRLNRQTSNAQLSLC
jgi:cell division inhibitor SulA